MFASFYSCGLLNKAFYFTQLLKFSATGFLVGFTRISDFPFLLQLLSLEEARKKSLLVSEMFPTLSLLHTTKMWFRSSDLLSFAYSWMLKIYLFFINLYDMTAVTK